MLKKRILILIMIFFLSSIVRGQYYEFTGNSNNGFQQGCSETYDVYFNTEGVGGITVGQPLVTLDDTKIEYVTGGNLRNNLFNLYITSLSGFTDRVSASYPQWAINYTKIYLNAKNENSSAVGGYRRHGNFIFIPKYDHTGVNFVFDYDGTNQKTSLAKDGNNVINITSQSSRLTGNIIIDRKPCLADITSPSITDNIYVNLGTRVLNNGLNIDLRDSVGNGSTPYVYTGGGIWTGNLWSINNQYGIDSGTVSVTVSGNGQTVTFDEIADFTWTPSNKTWQYKDRDYNIIVSSGDLFNFGIEELISISYSVLDRTGNTKTNLISFNHPHNPFVSNIFPANNEVYVGLAANVGFKISDDWAGIDSGSILVTLSGIDNNFLGYYSGNDLLLSGIVGIADYPDYNVSFDHLDFPTSSTIKVTVYGLDLAGNGGVLSNRTFTTRPDCYILGCCLFILQTGDETTQFYYGNSQLYISGGNNAFLSYTSGITGYINCNMQDQGMSIYKGVGEQNTGVFMGFHDLANLKINGNNVKAILSGNTITLQRISYFGGGGGGGSIEKDDCPDGDTSLSYYDGECGEYHNSPDECGVNDSEYSMELRSAYSYSYGYGITTMCPISEADLDGYLYRNHFAKMISQFAINVLGDEPNVGKEGCDNFEDIDGDTEELKGFMKTACELGLMGLEADGITPKKVFNPEGFVTRAEFGTVFSRLLFGGRYNIKDEAIVFEQEGFWYKDHLDALKRYGVMTKIDGDWPKKLELRGWIMLMMQRADMYGIFAGKIPALNGIKALFE